MSLCPIVIWSPYGRARQTKWHATPPVQRSISLYPFCFHHHPRSPGLRAATAWPCVYTAVGLFANEPEVRFGHPGTIGTSTGHRGQCWNNQCDNLIRQCEWLRVQRVGLEPARDDYSWAEHCSECDLCSHCNWMDRRKSHVYQQCLESNPSVACRRQRCDE